MAAAKKKGKQAPKSFPKEEGVEGAPDRFIPPDRQDQIPNEDGDVPQVVSVKDLSEGMEIVEDPDDGQGGEPAEGGEGGEGGEGRRAQAQTRERVPRESDDGDEGLEPEEDRSYGRKVRARINRERALRKQDRIRAENAERRARAVEDRLAKLERVTTEVQGSNEVKVLEAKIAQLKKDLAEAVEKGETAKQMEATIALGDAQADLKLLKRDMEAARRKSIEDEAARKTAGADEGAADTGGDGEGAPSVDDWTAANKTWWNKPKFARQKRVAIALDGGILDEIANGELDIEKYSDEHFELLNQRLAEAYPDLPLYNLDGEPYTAAEEEDDVTTRDRDRDSRSTSSHDRNGGRRPPVGGQGTRSSGRRTLSDADLARQGKVRLTTADYTQMRMYGLDPANADHKKAFARERMRTVLTEDRRGTSRGAR